MSLDWRINLECMDRHLTVTAMSHAVVPFPLSLSMLILKRAECYKAAVDE